MKAAKSIGCSIRTLAVLIVCISVAPASYTQTFTSLFSFAGSNGIGPQYGALVQGIDGNYYGTTTYGGTNSDPDCAFDGSQNSCGTVFKISPGGALTTIYNFCTSPTCPDGGNPVTGLVLGTDGNFYGTTNLAGAFGAGSVFKITPLGTLTTLHSFNGADGVLPFAPLVQATDGNFYGTTAAGSSTLGSVFKITPSGTFTTLHNFDGHDGSFPRAALVQGSDGFLYGTTAGDGLPRPFQRTNGTVFRISPDGNFVTLHVFAGFPTDGQTVYGGLVQGSDGTFYGTTAGGGRSDEGIIFKIAPDGTYTILFDFNFNYYLITGAYPYDGLVQATDGYFYGTAVRGGANDLGVVFRMAPSGKVNNVHSFDDAGGKTPWGGLLQATDGKFYGTTTAGGTTSFGTVFGVSVGLAPFVKTLPTSSRVGRSIRILGNELGGATSVTFNGTPATFTVHSSTVIEATVPSGATTGPVEVTLPTGTLTSNVVFQVR